MKAAMFCAVVVLMGLKPLRAQTVSPVVVECPQRCKGQFTVSNDSLAPVVSTVTVTNFEPTKVGSGRPLPLTAQVHLDTTSARIGPRNSHTFFYDATCAQLPCAIRFTASQVVGKTKEGIQVKILLGHVAYICKSAKKCRDTQLSAAGAK